MIFLTKKGEEYVKCLSVCPSVCVSVPDFVPYLVADQLYKHRCLSVRLSVCLSVCLFICPKFCIQVNVTSTEARQAASSCTVDWNEVLPTQRKWRPMPTQICQPHSATPVRESYLLGSNQYILYQEKGKHQSLIIRQRANKSQFYAIFLIRSTVHAQKWRRKKSR